LTAWSDAPRVSIVIPVYNEGEAIGPWLGRIFNGVKLDWEVLVVYDDCPEARARDDEGRRTPGIRGHHHARRDTGRSRALGHRRCQERTDLIHPRCRATAVATLDYLWIERRVPL
jgi:hypothetical protein